MKQKTIATSPSPISCHEEERSMSLPEVFLASPSPSQASEGERRMTATSGRTCCVPYGKSAPLELLVRTLLGSYRWYNKARRLRWAPSPIFSERVTHYMQSGNLSLPIPSVSILSVRDIPSSLSLYRLVPVAHRTAVTGYGSSPTGMAPPSLKERMYGNLLPTPTASDADVGDVVGTADRFILAPDGTVRKVNWNGHEWKLNLARTAQLLSAGCPVLAARNQEGLEEAITGWVANRMMPTPTARDWKGAASLESLEKRGRNPEMNSLSDFFTLVGKDFQLNPLFVGEMMGFPSNWTVSPFLAEGKKP